MQVAEYKVQIALWLINRLDYMQSDNMDILCVDCRSFFVMLNILKRVWELENND